MKPSSFNDQCIYSPCGAVLCIGIGEMTSEFGLSFRT